MDASALLEERPVGALGLRGSRCPACGHHAFPPRAVCTSCFTTPTLDVVLAGTGRVHAWTNLETPPAGFDQPIVYAAVDLDEGPRVLAPLEATPEPGGRVQVVARTVRDGHPGFGFVSCR